MNEHIINPWLFYWLDVLNTFNICLIILLVMCIIFILILGVNYGEYLEKVRLYSGSHKEEWYKEECKQAEKKLTFCVLFTLVIVLMSIFTPSSKTIVKMYIAQHITQNNIKVAGETIDKLIDKAVEKIIDIQKAKGK